MNPQLLPAQLRDDVPGWAQTVVAFLAEKERRSGSRRARDLSEGDYQAQRDAVRAALAALPDDDRIRSFDAYRARLLALSEAIAWPPRPAAKSSVGSWSSGSWCGIARSRRSIGLLPPGRSSKNSGSAPKGPWTPARCLSTRA
jgi:hypothetical protein